MKTGKRWTNIAQCYVNMLWFRNEHLYREDLFGMLAGDAGLYDVAYFVHKAKPGERALLRYLRKVANKVYDRNKHLFIFKQAMNEAEEIDLREISKS